MTLTPSAERLEVELSIPVFTTHVCRGLDSNTQLSACEANALTDCATAVVCLIVYMLFAIVSFCSCMFCCLVMFGFFGCLLVYGFFVYVLFVCRCIPCCFLVLEYVWRS